MEENILEVYGKKDENENQGRSWKGKEEHKNKMRSNPWQLGHLDNEINFEPLIPFLS